MFYGNGTFACPVSYTSSDRGEKYSKRRGERGEWKYTVMIMEVEDDERTDVQTSQYYYWSLVISGEVFLSIYIFFNIMIGFWVSCFFWGYYALVGILPSSCCCFFSFLFLAAYDDQSEQVPFLMGMLLLHFDASCLDSF